MLDGRAKFRRNADVEEQLGRVVARVLGQPVGDGLVVPLAGMLGRPGGVGGDGCREGFQEVLDALEVGRVAFVGRPRESKTGVREDDLTFVMARSVSE